MINGSFYTGYYDFSSYNAPPLDFNVSNFYFNPNSLEVACLPHEAEFLATEIFRIGWTIGRSIEEHLREGVGEGFLASTWSFDPAWGSRQGAFNKIAQKVKDFAVCSSIGVFANIQRGWSYLTESLKKETAPIELRTEVIPQSIDVGVFSDTPLLVSDHGPNLPNVVTLSEFEEIQEFYEAIKTGKSGIKIEGSLDFVDSILKDIRIILSTETGRELVSSLHTQDIQVIEGDRAMYLGESKTVTLKSQKATELTFGAPSGDKVNVLDHRASIFFHELTHAFHDLIEKDLTHFHWTERDEDNLWSNEEEVRTILKTNNFRRQLKEGEEDWYGRCFHHVLRSPSEVDFYFFKYQSAPTPENIDHLLGYNMRLDEKVAASDSIEEVYQTNVLKDPNRYLPSLATGGHLDLIQDLLKSIPFSDFSAKALGEALSNAAFQGHTEIVQRLIELENFREIPGNLIGKALLKASSGGYTTICEALIAACNLDELPVSDFFKILKQTILAKAEDHSLLLLKSTGFEALEPNHVGKILYRAVKQNLDSVVDFIIHSSRLNEIPTNYIKLVFSSLSRAGNKEFLGPILETKNFKEIEGNDLASSLDNSYYQTEDNAVELYLKTARLKLEQLNQEPSMGFGGLLRLASAYGDLDTIQYLLETPEIELATEDLNESFIAMASQGNPKTFQHLLESPYLERISSDCLGRALSIVYRSDNDLSTYSLLSSDRFEEISILYIRSLVAGAAHKGDLKFTQFILNSEHFEKLDISYLNGVFINACSNGWNGVAQMILSSHRAEDLESSSLEQAYLKAEADQNETIMELLSSYLN